MRNAYNVAFGPEYETIELDRNGQEFVSRRESLTFTMPGAPSPSMIGKAIANVLRQWGRRADSELFRSTDESLDIAGNVYGIRIHVTLKV